MKKNIYLKLLIILTVVFFYQVKGYCADVSNFTELNNAITGGETNINIIDNITFTNSLGTATSAIEIAGNDYILNGNNTYKGFNFGNNATLSKVQMNNFKGEGNYFGAAILTNANLTIRETLFKNNNSKYAGSGTVVAKGNAEIYNSLFDGNSCLYGSHIITADGKLDLYNSEIKKSNISSASSGINSGGNMNIENSTFSENTVSAAQGLLYSNGKLSIKESTFNNNHTETVLIRANDNLYISDSIFESNNSSNNFIQVSKALNILDSQVKNNTFKYPFIIQQSTSDAITIENLTFEGNVTEQPFFSVSSNNFNVYNSVFKNNSYNSPYASILRSNSNVNIYDSVFENNTGLQTVYTSVISASGNVVNIASITKDVLFKGNSSSYGSIMTGALNLFAGNIGSIIFEDSLFSISLLNINGDIPDTMDSRTSNSGTVIFNADMNKVQCPTNLYNGTLQIGPAMSTDNLSGYTNFVGGNFNVYNNPTLSLANGVINNLDATNWNITNNLNLIIDVDIENKIADYIDNNPLTGSMTINGINIFNEIGEFDNLEIAVTNDGTNFRLADNAKNIETPLYKYTVDDKNLIADGKLCFSSLGKAPGGSDFNKFSPSVLTSPTATQVGSYLNQLNIYDLVFANFDSITAMSSADRLALKYNNKYAINDGVGDYIKSPIPESTKGMWYRPYTTFESVGLSNGPSVSNVAYGILAGGDSGIIPLDKGWDAIYSAYVGYNGSHQNYSNVGIDQNGGVLGLSAMFLKDNFFAGLTLNAGANIANAMNKFGREELTTLTSGIAGKIGYNLNLLEDKLILQPNLLMSYTFINTFDYKNSAGLNINSEPLHSLQIAPGLKLVGNLKNSWQPYLSLQMVWNSINNTNFTANNVALPSMSIDPYFQYGIGLQKKIGDRFTGYGQAMIRNGGRNGIALSFGFRWALGNSEKL